VRRADGELSIYTIVSRTPRSRSDREARQQDYDDPGDWSLPSSASCQRVSVWGRRGVVRARFIAVWEPDGGGAWKWCGRRGAAPRRVSARWRVASGFGPRPPRDGRERKLLHAVLEARDRPQIRRAALRRRRVNTSASQKQRSTGPLFCACSRVHSSQHHCLSLCAVCDARISVEQKAAGKKTSVRKKSSKQL
jgi:hypothetical protein